MSTTVWIYPRWRSGIQQRPSSLIRARSTMGRSRSRSGGMVQHGPSWLLKSGPFCGLSRLYLESNILQLLIYAFVYISHSFVPRVAQILHGCAVCHAENVAKRRSRSGVGPLWSMSELMFDLRSQYYPPQFYLYSTCNSLAVVWTCLIVLLFINIYLIHIFYSFCRFHHID